MEIKMKNKKQINKVSKEEALDALEFFWQTANLDDDGDTMHYTKILMKKVANDYKIKLEGI
jgi:hypothetical protein